jgi:hypothetical protein
LAYLPNLSLPKIEHFAHFWRIPSEVRKYQRFPIVAGSIWRYVHRHHQHFLSIYRTLCCTDVSTRIWSR